MEDPETTLADPIVPPKQKPESIAERLASSANRRDEQHNVALAASICAIPSNAAISELIQILHTGNKPQRSDAIKVLYEIGYREPGMIAKFAEDFLQCLSSKDNRIVWGAMIALDTIAPLRPAWIASKLDPILSTAEEGTVISKDHAFGILVQIAKITRHRQRAVPELLRILRTALANQFPKYCEQSSEVLSQGDSVAEFHEILTKRKQVLEKESQRRRVAKVLSRLPAAGR